MEEDRSMAMAQEQQGREERGVHGRGDQIIKKFQRGTQNKILEQIFDEKRKGTRMLTKPETNVKNLSEKGKRYNLPDSEETEEKTVVSVETGETKSDRETPAEEAETTVKMERDDLDGEGTKEETVMSVEDMSANS
jgi:hypothetical protein